MSNRHGNSRSRRARRVIVVGITALASLASACTPAVTPDGKDPEIEALLEDPQFRAQLGDTEQEREVIVADIRKFLDEWDAWGMDPAELERVAMKKVDYERERAAAEERDSAQLEAQARKERERLNALQNGPTIDEIAAGDTERTEDYDYGATREHWGTVQGFAESMQTLSDRRADTEVRVRKMIEQLSASGELERVDQIPGYVPSEGEGDPMYGSVWAEARKERGPATGACKDREGNRAAPSPASLRPGSMYSPHQNTFAGSNGTPTHVGQLKTTTLGGKKHFIVEGHLGDLDVFGFTPGVSINTVAQAWITVHTPTSLTTDYYGLGPFYQMWVPGTPILSGQVQILCYTDDFPLATGAPIRRAMFRAFIPMDPEGVLLTEPGFQVKAAVSDISWDPAFFFGADMRTVYLGKQPLGYNQTFTNGGFGVNMGRGVVVNDNAATNDDLESAIRGPVQTKLTEVLSGLDDTSWWVLGKKNAGSSWGWFGFHINNSAPNTPNVDIDWSPTTVGGAQDDEYRLKGSLSMTDWLVEGYVSLPWAAFGLVPCYFRMKIDLSASVYASVDIHDTARTVLQPDIEIGPIGIGVHNLFASPVPLGCNSIYLFKFVDSWDDKLNELLPLVNQVLANKLQVQPNIGNVVPPTVPVGGGQIMNTLFAGWNDTCAPYACNGSHAGDMAMNWAGLEATGDIRFTDTKSALAARRFPASYSPTTAGTANDRVRSHFGPQNEITDFGAWVNPAVLNQALRVIAEQGRLDLNLDASTPGLAKSPPIYLSTPIAADKPLGVFVPHIEIDPAGPNLFAVDVFAAVGVNFDPLTRKLVPSTIAPSDPALGIAMWTLSCDGTVWALCNGIPAIVSGAANWAANTLLNPLLQNSIGQITIPQTGSFSLSGVKIVNEDGHLGLRASVGATELRAWGGINASTYSFDTYHEGFPGAGPVTYSWQIKDNVSGLTILTATGTQHQYSGLSTAALTTLNIPIGPDVKSATATVTATRGGVSKTATYTNTIFL